MKKPILAEILNEALMDEYNARNTYQKIINTFGPVRPFINIVEAEQTHIELLLPFYEKYTVPLPPEPDPNRVTVPDSLLTACELGVEEELANVAMYDRLIAATDLPDVVEVLQRLQAASRDHHLPAFQRCVERSSSTGGVQGFGSGRGKGPGMGWGFGRRENKFRSMSYQDRSLSEIKQELILKTFLMKSEHYLFDNKGITA
jgi:hypothetical protein